MRHQSAGHPTFARWAEDAVHLERALGLPPGFTRELVEGDDWAYVVKAHALLEMAVSQRLLHGADPRLAKIFRAMPLGGTRSSKLACADALGLLDGRSIELIRRLVELRAHLVHEEGGIAFSLSGHLRALPGHVLDRWAELTSRLVALTRDEAESGSWPWLLTEQPKAAVTLAIYAVLAQADTGGGAGGKADAMVLLGALRDAVLAEARQRPESA